MLQGQTGSSHLQQAKPPRLLSSPVAHKQKRQGQTEQKKQRFFHFHCCLSSKLSVLLHIILSQKNSFSNEIHVNLVDTMFFY